MRAAVHRRHCPAAEALGVAELDPPQLGCDAVEGGAREVVADI
jgi:hypothetical protein